MKIAINLMLNFKTDQFFMTII